MVDVTSPRASMRGAEREALLLVALRSHRAGGFLLPILVLAAAAGAFTLLRRRHASRATGDEAAAQGPPVLAASPPVGAAPRTLWRPVASGTNRIEARELTKSYGERLAVDHLTFDVAPGRVTGFLGPNGAGKSTTMRLIMGLDSPSGGSVTVSGRSFHDLDWPLREVGALLEASSVHPGRSAFNHLWMLAQTNRIPRARVEELLDLVGLTPVAQQLVGRFSLGMKQRLGIATALLGDPGILLFDEPVNGLDTDGIRWVRQLLRRLAGEGRAVFVSSHLMSEAARTADQVVVIGKGRLLAESSVEDFTSSNAQRSVRVRSPQLDALRDALERAGASISLESDGAAVVRGIGAEAVGELAAARSIVLHELTPQSASLEEAFVESTEGDLEYRGDGPRRVPEESGGALR